MKNSFKNEFIDYIKSQQKFGSGVCLQRVTLVMEALRLDTYVDKCARVVVTGTNGKGSVSSITASILSKLDRTVGLFTSPHFYNFNERFKVNGVVVDYIQLTDAAKFVGIELENVSSRTGETFGVFEVQFIIALFVFRELGVDTLVIEAGIGGRYDPCRLLKASRTALTSVDLEHTALLGNSLELISFDKMDACAVGGTIVSGIIQNELRTKQVNYAELTKRNILFSEDLVKVTIGNSGIADININNQINFQCPTNLYGDFQERNIATAIALVQTLDDHISIEIIERAVVEGLCNLEILGRFQKLSESPNIYIDSAHTPAAFASLFKSIKSKFSGDKLIFVTGFSEGREVNSLINGLNETAHAVVLTSPTFKGAPIEDMERQFDGFEPALYIEEDLSVALKKARQLCIDDSYTIFVAGGLFLAGEASALIQGQESQEIFLY